MGGIHDSAQGFLINLFSPFGNSIPAEFGLNSVVARYAQLLHLLRVLKQAVNAPCYRLGLYVCQQSILEVPDYAYCFSCYNWLACVPSLKHHYAKGLIPAGYAYEVASIHQFLFCSWRSITQKPAR